MRSPDVSYNQTKEAVFDKNITWRELLGFRGICFALVLRWLEVKSQGANDLRSIAKLRENDNFTQLFNEFTLQSKSARELKRLLEQEKKVVQDELTTESDLLEARREVAMLLDVSSLDVPWVPDQVQVAPLQQAYESRAKVASLVERRNGIVTQQLNLFSSEEEQALGDVGTASEELLRKLFGYKLKVGSTSELKTLKSSFFSTKKDWDDVAKVLEENVVALSTQPHNLFEIGLYGSGAHSIGLWCSSAKAGYALFDPNYGVFAGDWMLNHFWKDLSALLQDRYPKMNKVVLSWLEKT